MQKIRMSHADLCIALITTFIKKIQLLLVKCPKFNASDFKHFFPQYLSEWAAGVTQFLTDHTSPRRYEFNRRGKPLRKVAALTPTILNIFENHCIS